MALTAGKTLLGTTDIKSCNQIKFGSSNVTRMFVGETIIFPWNVFSLTGIKYNTESQASLCGGNGGASELHWVDCSSLDVGDYVWTNSGRTTLAATGWYGTGGAGSTVYYVNPAGVVSSIGTCPSCVCVEGFQLSTNNITVSCDDASGLNGRVIILVRSILCRFFQVRLITTNGLIQTAWQNGDRGGDPASFVQFTFTGVDDGTYRVQMAESGNESCSAIFTLSNINVNCFVPTPTPTNTPTPTPTPVPYTYRLFSVYSVSNDCELSLATTGYTKNSPVNDGYYYISSFNPDSFRNNQRYYVELYDTYIATSDPVGMNSLSGFTSTSCTPPTATPVPTNTPTPTPPPTNTPEPTATPCPSYGTYIGEFCGGAPDFNKIGIFADGSCGTYNSVIAYNDPACGYVAPTATPVPTNTPVPTATPTPVPICYTWYNYQGYDIYIDFVDCSGNTQNGYFVYDGGSVCAQIMYSSTMDSSFATC